MMTFDPYEVLLANTDHPILALRQFLAAGRIQNYSVRPERVVPPSTAEAIDRARRARGLTPLYEQEKAS